jgi:hypothetical protein
MLPVSGAEQLKISDAHGTAPMSSASGAYSSTFRQERVKERGGGGGGTGGVGGKRRKDRETFKSVAFLHVWGGGGGG